MLTCSRLLNDEASGNGVVIVPEVPAGNYEDEIETDFNMDILCCDPDETEVGFTRLNSKQLQYLVNFMYIRALWEQFFLSNQYHSFVIWWLTADYDWVEKTALQRQHVHKIDETLY